MPHHLSDKHTSIATHLESLKQHLLELESGKKSAAPKARLSAKAARDALHLLRKDIMTHVKALPVQSRTSSSHN